MHLIHKQPFPITDEFVLQLPVRAIIRHVAVQNDTPYIWYDFEVTNPDDNFRPRWEVEERTFRIVGTGNSFSDAFDCQFVATFFESIAVWHLYEKVA